MDLVQAAVNGAVVAIVAAVAGYVINQRFEGLERRMDRFEDRIESRLLRVEDALGQLRSDLTRVALAVGAGPRPQAG